MTLVTQTITIPEWLFKWAMTNPRDEAPSFYEGEQTTSIGSIITFAELQATWNDYHEMLLDLQPEHELTAMISKSPRIPLPSSVLQYLTGVTVFAQYCKYRVDYVQISLTIPGRYDNTFKNMVEISDALGKERKFSSSV